MQNSGTEEASSLISLGGTLATGKPGFNRRRIRFGVAFRLMAALLAIMLFAGVSTVATLYVFAKYRQGFDRIASSSLPILIAASDVVARSRTLATNAPNLAGAESHFARQATTEGLHRQLDGLTEIVERLRQLSLQPEALDRLVRDQELLKRNIELLDRLVADRIEADSSAANLMLRLRGLAARMHSVSSAQLAIVLREGSENSAEPFLTWMSATGEAVAVMQSTSTADTVIRLKRLSADFEKLRGEAVAAFARLPAQATQLGVLETAVDQYGHGNPNVFAARSTQLTSESAVRGALIDTQHISSELMASAQSFFQDVERDTNKQSVFISDLITKYSGFFSVISVLALAGFALAFLYIVRSVILRLRKLSDSMRARVDGLDVPIPVAGTDEIAEMATAAQFFVTSLEERERTLKDRTAELTQLVSELRALGEVGQAVNSTIDLETVLSTIVAKAVQLSGTDAGTIWVFAEKSQEFRLRASYGMDAALVAGVKGHPIRLGEKTVVDQAALQRMPVQIVDVQHEDPSQLLDVIVRAGFRAVLTVPLLSGDRMVGALVVRRKEPGEFPAAIVSLMRTFADQSAIALENARLFDEIAQKSRELEIASQHKSQFVANMSHELRTPLAAILGYAELMQEGFYEPLGKKSLDALTRIRSNGKHLLGLINTVLDIAKIESGQFSLNLSEYALDSVVETVRVATESLAETKKLSLKTEIVEKLPVGLGDEQRLTQVLLNLVGNAIKFTNAGEVRIIATAVNGQFTVAVTDTGPGIPPEELKRVFEQFHQIDNSNTKAKGGTGLALAIAKQIVEMHGGRIWVESTLGKGATFQMELPVRAESRKGTA